jgi:DNA (cytosine-5)-methyltransferase 1
VPGLLSIEGGVVFEQVCLDLESEGYEVQAFVLPACATGAPHRRDRVWIVAYSNEVRRGSGFGSIPKANGEISERYENAESCNAGTGNDSNSSNTRVKGLRQERQNQIHGLEPTPKTQQIVHRSEDGVEWANSNIKKKRLERGEEIRNIKRIGQESYEQYKRLYDGNCWANWPSISPFHSGHDGLSEELVRHIRTTLSEAGQTPEQIEAYLRKESSWLRKEAIKCAGNAIVPQVVLQVMKAIQNHYEQYGK